GRWPSSRAPSRMNLRRRGRPPEASAQSSLEFLLQFVQEAPVGSLRDQLLRRALHHSGLPQPQRVEPDGLLRVVVAPLAIRQLTDRLSRILRIHSETLIQ